MFVSALKAAGQRWRFTWAQLQNLDDDVTFGLQFSCWAQTRRYSVLSPVLHIIPSSVSSTFPPNSRMPVLIISQWKTRGWCEGGAGTPGRVIQYSPAEREKVGGKKSKIPLSLCNYCASGELICAHFSASGVCRSCLKLEESSCRWIEIRGLS